MADIRTRLFGPSSTPTGNDDVVMDIGALLRRLLLFDTYIMESHRLAEIPYLVKAIGWSGVVELLKSGALRIHLDAAGLVSGRLNDDSEPVKAFALGTFRTPDHLKYVEGCMEALGSLGLRDNNLGKLRGAIIERLQPKLPDEALAAANDQWKADLNANVPSLSEALSLVLQKHLGRVVDPDEFIFEIELSGDGYYMTQTDLSQRYGLDKHAERQVVERALLGHGNLSVRLQYMDAYTALNGMRGDDLPFFVARLRFLEGQLSPEAQEKRLQRVVRIDGLPDLSAEGLRIGRFLEVRETRECKEFREWLRTLDDVSDEEVRQRVESIRARLATWARSGPGKALRLFATTASGFIPGVGLAVGPTLGGLDSFLVEKLLPESGPVTFLSRLYPSVFDRP